MDDDIYNWCQAHPNVECWVVTVKPGRMQTLEFFCRDYDDEACYIIDDTRYIGIGGKKE